MNDTRTFIQMKRARTFLRSNKNLILVSYFRICMISYRYFYSPVDGTPYSLAAVFPDGYGMYELQAEQELKHSPINGTSVCRFRYVKDWII